MIDRSIESASKKPVAATPVKVIVVVTTMVVTVAAVVLVAAASGQQKSCRGGWSGYDVRAWGHSNVNGRHGSCIEALFVAVVEVAPFT
jgi:hypothetical protein